MEPLTVCNLQYTDECNIYGDYCPTNFTEEIILINSSQIESVKLAEITFWYLQVTEETRGIFWKTIYRFGERKELRKEIFYQLTLASGEKLLTQHDGFSELLSLNKEAGK